MRAGPRHARNPRLRRRPSPAGAGRTESADQRSGVLLAAPEPADNPGKAITRILAEARNLLGMEVAFVSEFKNGMRIFRFVEGEHRCIGLDVDSSDPLENTYCARVVDGQIPCLIPDAQEEPGVADLPVTKELSIGGHMSVPIVFSDGRIYGTFCCFSQSPKESLDERHVSMIRVMAGLVTDQLEHEALEAESRRATTERIRDVLGGHGLEMVFQPIVELASSSVLGVEALARFHAEPKRTPDLWFEEAWTAGLGVDLELAAVRAATSELSRLPSGHFMSMNISPETALSVELHELLAENPCERIVMELTEHSRVAEYGPVRSALDRIRALGARIAIDDVGTGYAGLQQLLELRPDILKLDLSITRGIDADPARHSLAGSVAAFATEMDLRVVAEGVETRAEADALAGLGIELGQGYFFGRPGPIAPPS